MPKPGDYILVHLVEPASVGTQFQRTRGAWPLHITLATWFSCDYIEGLYTKLAKIAQATKPFAAEVGEEAMFGSASDVPVNIVVSQAEIADLHELLTEAVQTGGGVFEPAAWIDKGYRAHITHHGEHRRYAGDEETVADFHLVQLLPPNTCEVIAEYELGGISETAT